MNYEEAVAYIEETPKFTTKNKLEHTKECLRRLGSPEERFKVIHVAGTNGKGSTCAFLTSILREAGYSCGLFTSPHLVVINERFQINEKNIDTFLDILKKNSEEFSMEMEIALENFEENNEVVSDDLPNSGTQQRVEEQGDSYESNEP